jgi:hypothetical protein
MFSVEVSPLLPSEKTMHLKQQTNKKTNKKTDYVDCNPL